MHTVEHIKIYGNGFEIVRYYVIKAETTDIKNINNIFIRNMAKILKKKRIFRFCRIIYSGKNKLVGELLVIYDYIY